VTLIAGLVFGVLGLATVLVEPTVGAVCGLIGLGCSWLALRMRRSSFAYGALVLNIAVVAGVLLLVVFGSGSKSGSGVLPAT
jgi:hypothetical protein